MLPPSLDTSIRYPSTTALPGSAGAVQSSSITDERAAYADNDLGALGTPAFSLVLFVTGSRTRASTTLPTASLSGRVPGV